MSSGVRRVATLEEVAMAVGGNGVPTRPVREQSVAELVTNASEQMSRLVRDELQLARIELVEKGRRAGMGAGLFGVAGLVALYGVGALILAAIFGLDAALPLWLSALIIGVALLLIAGVMALIGRQQVRRAMPPVPAAASRSMRKDMDVVATAVRERGRS